LFIFGFLSFVRFLSDPDFWLDWTAYGIELQLGIALALGVIINRVKPKVFFSFLVSVFFVLLFSYLVKNYVLGSLRKDIKNSVEYRIGQVLSERVKPGETVFLSGSSVFWLNAFFNISQIRGGNDASSVNRDWRKAAWEIREGEDIEKTINWMKKLNISWLVVHTSESKEFFHDFIHPEKFEGTERLEKVYDQNGDKIYFLKEK